jgi:hypothetical protein
MSTIEVVFGRSFQASDSKNADLTGPQENPSISCQFLQDNHFVKKSINKFWLICDKNVYGSVDKEIVIALLLRLCRVLHPDIIYRDAIKIVEIDWIRDSQNQDSLTYDQFFASIYEIADTWSPTRNGPAFSAFLDKVFVFSELSK